MLNWEHIFATRATRMRASEIRELLKLLDRPEIISFAGGIPDPALFPAQVFSDAYTRVLNGPSAGTALQYAVSEGNMALRTWLAGYMASLGVPCDASNIIITSGSQQALDYIGKLFLSPGDTALVNWPTYLGALQAFNAYEPRYDRLIPLGNRPAEDFAAAARDAGGDVKFAYASADFANPTGETLDRATREKILDLADTLDIAVIEDAAYQSLRYDGEAIPPMLALDIARKGHINDTRVLYCGSFSKTMAPGLRVGWICGAEQVISKIVLLKQAADLNTSTINQMVLADVSESYFDTQVATIKASYRARRDAMLKALSTHMPAGCSWSKPDGGMFIWVTVPEGLDGATLLARSLESVKVAFVPGRAFFADGSGGNTLRLSFSCANEAQIEEGISRLGKLLEEAIAGL